MVTEYEQCMKKRITSIDKSLNSISKSLAKIAKAKEEAQAESNREMNSKSWDTFNDLSKLSGTKLL